MDEIKISLSMRQGLVTLNAGDADFSKKLMAAQVEHEQLLFKELTASLKMSSERGDAYRDLTIGEIIRCQQLAAPKDDKGVLQYDAKSETEFLETLPADKLRLHYDRRPMPKAEKPTIPGAIIVDSDDLYTSLGVDAPATN